MASLPRELLRELEHGPLRAFLERVCDQLDARGDNAALLELLGRHMFPEVSTLDARLTVGSLVTMRGEVAVAARAELGWLPDGVVVERSAAGRLRLAFGGLIPVRLVGWAGATEGQTVYLSITPGWGTLTAPAANAGVRCRLGEILRRGTNPLVWVATWGPFRVGGQG